MAENNGMVKGLVIGLLAGGAIGAIVALLYAPKSGKELRADIREKADGRSRRKDEVAPGNVFLEDIILEGQPEMGKAESSPLCFRDDHGKDDRGRSVCDHPDLNLIERDAIEKDLHILQRTDCNPDLSDLTLGKGVVRIVT